jgi:RimJ/RimL family protein N-acetyltransferase
LLLRPTRGTDAARAFEIQSDWEVARMLAMATFPPDLGELSHWFADHAREWSVGEAHRFALEIDGRMVGVADLASIRNSEAELGYWLERTAWGRGYALEAARALVQFASHEVGLLRLKAGHAEDNPASGRILSKLGFKLKEQCQGFSKSRNQAITRRLYELSLTQ